MTAEITLEQGSVQAFPARGGRRTRRLSPEAVLGALRVADAGVVLVAGLATAALALPADEHGPTTVWAPIVALLLSARLFRTAGLYRFERLGGLAGQLGRLVPAWAGTCAALALATGAASPLADRATVWLWAWFATGLAGLVALRWATSAAIRAWQRAGRFRRNIVVVGAGELCRRLIESLRGHAAEVQLIGLFDDRRDRVPHYVAGYPVLGTIDDLMVFTRRHRVDEIVVALPWSAEKRLLGCLERLKLLPVDVKLCTDLIGFHLPCRGPGQIAGVPLVGVHERPLAGWRHLVKAVEDRLLAAAILIFVAPLMLAVALAVKLGSPGPVLYRQKRYGFNNEIIEVCKFRSMLVVHCDDGTGGAVPQATRRDPRVTPVGRFLRRTSLDELPQLLNVLKGEMSIVGPRPHAVAHNERYAALIGNYLARHRVKPGITGWAQVNGLRGETDTLDKMRRRVEHDLHYIENWSLAFDLEIILRTLVVGFFGRNVY